MFHQSNSVDRRPAGQSRIREYADNDAAVACTVSRCSDDDADVEFAAIVVVVTLVTRRFSTTFVTLFYVAAVYNFQYHAAT